MVFSSLVFLYIFLPLTLLAYYLLPKRFRNAILLIASLIFYGWGEPMYILIMIFSTVFDYANGLIIHRFSDRKRIKKSVLIISMAVNLGILCFFKYLDFFIDNINGLLRWNIRNLALPLPVGISFYTFQTMSYTIDVYLGKVKPKGNIIDFGAYVTMFPQLVAGPIVKYLDVEDQLTNRKENLNSFARGMELFIIGLAKKVLLANNIGNLWNSVKALPIEEVSLLTSWLGILAFTFQIYFDFSGYSDMAIGLGRIFGFEFMKNFDFPYMSKSITEFWRRWHISLGSWFREYVYIPLGGNRKGKLKEFRNLFVVWLLTGFWHGANWNFILWGMYFCLFICLEKVFLLKWLKRKPGFVGHIYCFLVVVIGWVFFDFESLHQATTFIKTMFGEGTAPFIDNRGIYYLKSYLAIFGAVFLCSMPYPRKFYVKIKGNLDVLGAIVIPVIFLIILLLSTAYLVNETYNPFLYFRF